MVWFYLCMTDRIVVLSRYTRYVLDDHIEDEVAIESC